MVSVTATFDLMERIEKKYPNLIYCFGTVDIQDPEMEPKCGTCRFISECHRRKRELEGDEFKIGKYRPGFGKPKNVYRR